jgi:hypothetical protein
METLLSSAATEGTSSEVVLEADQKVTIILTGKGYVRLQVKGVGDAFSTSAEMNGLRTESRTGQVAGPLTFRMYRPEQARAVAVGMEEG